VAVLADNLPGPDDLALGADGSIYISDVSDRTVKQYTPDGKLRVVVSGLSEPEGIVILPNGSLLNGCIETSHTGIITSTA
jgi:sugar lactone lactonase YvrE